MRPRLPCPIRPFDSVPRPVVERCKSIFSLRTDPNVSIVPVLDRRPVLGIQLEGHLIVPLAALQPSVPTDGPLPIARLDAVVDNRFHN